VKEREGERDEQQSHMPTEQRPAPQGTYIGTHVHTHTDLAALKTNMHRHTHTHTCTYTHTPCSAAALIIGRSSFSAGVVPQQEVKRSAVVEGTSAYILPEHTHTHTHTQLYKHTLVYNKHTSK
jgi:hypothetical protein